MAAALGVQTRFNLTNINIVILVQREVYEEESKLNVEAADQVKRRRRQSVKVKGIARVADEVRELFLKVAVSDTKLVAGSNKEVSAAVCVCLFYYSSATHSKCLMSSSFNTHSCFPTSHW